MIPHGLSDVLIGLACIGVGFIIGVLATDEYYQRAELEEQEEEQ